MTLNKRSHCRIAFNYLGIGFTQIPEKTSGNRERTGIVARVYFPITAKDNC